MSLNKEKIRLIMSALVKYVSGLLLVGLLVFLPAGTLNFANGWLFLGVLFLPILLLGIVLFIKAPELLKKRLEGKEDENTQRKVVGFSALIFVLGFIIAGLDFRFGWSKVPNVVAVIALVLFLASYTIYAEVMRENAYLSRKIEVQQGQKVVDTGLYGVVRHPMYMSTVFLFLSIPIMLGSWYSLLVFLVYPILIAVRIKNEEQVLTENLQGYAEYKQKVKYRLIPFVW